MPKTLTADLTGQLVRLKELRERKAEIEDELRTLNPLMVDTLRELDIEVPLPEIAQRAHLITPTLLTIPDMRVYYALATRGVYNATTARVPVGAKLRDCWDAHVLGKAQKAVEPVAGVAYVRFDRLG